MTSKEIYLAGGCFWGTEHFFKQIAGVIATETGFANGHTDAADRAVIDRVYSEEQTKYAEPLVVEREPLQNFYPADEYHQDYLDKNPDGYCHLPKALFDYARRARKRIEVVAAVIVDADGRVFATQRGYGDWKDWWEFPGGKMETGESRAEALKREIREELDAEIEVGELMRTINYDYPNFHLTMHCFRCRLMGGVTLREHEAAQWLAPSELNSVQWLPADEEIIETLRSIG